MSTTILKKAEKSRLSVKTQTLAALTAIVAAVAVPQLFHAVGAVSGLGTALGETFLPMHLPILMVGLLAGPYAGLAAGAAGPLVSFALSGMPAAAMLPFMVIELAVYGLAAGLLREVKMPLLVKVIIAQVAGRVVRAAAILIAIYGLGSTSVAAATIWGSIVTGLPGLILQWSVLPLLVFWVENRQKNER